jgi:hypothetical protein
MIDIFFIASVGIFIGCIALVVHAIGKDMDDFDA